VSLDIDFDAISHAVKVTGLWTQRHRPLLIQAEPGHRTEVGVLGLDKPANLEADELAMAGHLTVLGQDSKPSSTLFSFPSRHRHADASFSTTFLQPTGLHPTMQMRISSNKPPSDDSFCSLHAYMTLPRTVFSDKYQLADPLFLASKNLTALRHVSQPVDLEAPEYTTKVWGSSVLLELSNPTSPAAPDESWTAEVPLHLRYLAPWSGGHQQIQVPYPVLFWACNTEEGTKFPTNPFDRVNLGYDGLFGPRTVFWHLDPQPATGSARLTSEITVPVLDTLKTSWVNAGTAAAILLGFAWVLYKMFSVYVVAGHGPEAKATKQKKEQ